MLPIALGRVNFLIIGLIITCFLFYTSFRAPRPNDQDVLDYPSTPPLAAEVSAPPRPSASPTNESNSIYRVQNETLGFQDIYVISLPSRTDKQDAFAMQAALSNISYTQIDGVDGQWVPPKALPHTMDQSSSVIGCWRAHLNVLQKMVHEKVSSALIFEDDADWDVAIKQQLVQFARGSRFIVNHTDEVAHSPYGDNWDILWIGHCGTWVLPVENRRFFVIPDDPTVEPPQFRNNVDQPNMVHWEGGLNGDNRTRIVFNSEGGVCTAGYAISQRGARKALYHMSMMPYNSPVDWGYANLCKNKEYDMTCVSVFPQIVGVSRPTAHTSKWSDIGYGNDADRGVEEANSLHIVYSTRLNMGKLLEGKTVFDSQYPDVVPSMDIKDIGTAVGHVEVLDPEDLPQKTDAD